MNPAPERSSIRMDARLDAATRQKVDDLAQRFHTLRAAVLCHIMHWGLNHGPTGPLDQGESQGPVRHLYLYVESKLHEQVEKAATAAGVTPLPGYATGWARSRSRISPPAGRRRHHASAPTIPASIPSASCCGSIT
jgi:hypothetical protein